MLTQDQIKKATQFADGFDLINDGDDMFPAWNLYCNGGYINIESRDIYNSTIYDLFLFRAICGINRAEDKCDIAIGKHDISILKVSEENGSDHVNEDNFPHAGTTKTIRDVMERAIVFCLGYTK